MEDILLGLRDTLDSLPGIAYVVDREGVILAVSKTQWTRFAEENGGAAIADPRSVVGTSLFDRIAGEQVRAFYRELHQSVISGVRHRRNLPYRCDAPDTARELRMLVSALWSRGRIVGALYQNVPLAQRPLLHAALTDDPKAPIVAVCSQCKRVRVPPEDARAPWKTVEEYIDEGGTPEAHLSHGLCGACLQTAFEDDAPA